MHLIGEFREKDALIAAIQSLKTGGFGAADLAIFSEEPVELRRGILDRPSHMSLIAVSGGIVMGAAATAFVYYAQHDYQLNTGGMPVFSFWATGVITYEMIMLGAVLATFCWFLWESGLIRKRDKTEPIPEVNPAAMCLRVRCLPEQADGVHQAMYHAGATWVDHREQA